MLTTDQLELSTLTYANFHFWLWLNLGATMELALT